MKKNRRESTIVIIGAGPAGIATAVEARKHGFNPEQIVILEKAPQIVHMIAAKYPEEKRVLANYKGVEVAKEGALFISDMSKAQFLKYMDEIVEVNDLDVKFNQCVTKITQLRTGQFGVETSSYSYLADAVFVAIGNSSSPRLMSADLDPEILSHVHYDIQNLNLGHEILIVGGGDSAGEYAQILSERGQDVTMSYRGHAFVRMLDENAKKTNELIENGVVRYLPNTEIEKVTNVLGRLKVEFREKKYSLMVDSIVAALGNEKPSDYLLSLGIRLSSLSEDGESTMNGMYFLGDLSSGKKGGSINSAFSSATKAFRHAKHYYL